MHAIHDGLYFDKQQQNILKPAVELAITRKGLHVKNKNRFSFCMIVTFLYCSSYGPRCKKKPVFVACEQQRRRSAALSQSLLSAIHNIRFIWRIISKFDSCKQSIFYLFSVAELADVSFTLLGSKEEGEDQDMIQSSTTPDLGHHMGK